MDALLPSDPTQIDGYVVEGRLGSGGFGIVYAATSPDGVPVAIKVLRPELSDDVRLRDRLAREADALGRVEGERTAEIFKVVTEGDLVYLVMERVEGESLTDQVNENGALSGPMLWFAATGLVQALQEIHAAGIVHRDLKPSNVMYGPDGVKVLDFGISVVADETALTQTGAFVGTGAWMAPEMVLGNDVTEKTDVYALGLVLAFIALGRHPFGEGRADALMYRIANTDPDLDGMSEPFLGAVSMCLQRDPDDRPALDELAGFFGSNGEQQLSATSIVGSDAGGTRIVQPAVAAASDGGNKKRNMVIGASIVAAAAVVGIIIGVTGGGGGGEGPPELADGEDTELQSDDVAFVQDDDEEPEEPVEPTPEPEPVEAEEEAEPEEETEEEEEEESAEDEEEEPEPEVEEVPDEVTETDLVTILTDTYSWGTGTAAKTSILQEALGLVADGSYGQGTRQAHLNALQTRDLSVANVPEEPIQEQPTPVSQEPSVPSPQCALSLNINPETFPWRSGGEITITVTVSNLSGPMWSNNTLDFEMMPFAAAGEGGTLNFGNSNQATFTFWADPLPSSQTSINLNGGFYARSPDWDEWSTSEDEMNCNFSGLGFPYYVAPSEPVSRSSCSISTLDLSDPLYLDGNVPPSFTVQSDTSQPPLPDGFVLPGPVGEFTRQVVIDGVAIQNDGPFQLNSGMGDDLNLYGQGAPVASPLPGETVSYSIQVSVTFSWDFHESRGGWLETISCSREQTFARPE